MKKKTRNITINGTEYVWMVKNDDHVRYLTVWTDKQNKIVDGFGVEDKVDDITPRFVKDIIEYVLDNHGSLPKIKYPIDWGNVNKYALFNDLSLGVKFKYSYCSSKVYVKISYDTIALWDDGELDKNWVGQPVLCFADGNDGAPDFVWIAEQ